MKVILGTYVAAITADAAGIMLANAMDGSKLFASLMELTSVANESDRVIFLKIIIFVALIILISVKGALTVDTAEESSWVFRTILNVVYAIFSAGLIINIILVFVSGLSFVSLSDPKVAEEILIGISADSEIIQSIVKGAYLWFSIPALAFIAHSFYSGEAE